MTEPFLKGRVALVTGASRGFGFASAAALGAAGAHVLAVARTVGGLEDLDDQIGASGGTATLIPLDIGDDPGLERLGAAVHERWGRVDLWLHTAFHAPPLQPAEHIDARELDRSLATNVRAFQRLIRAVDPLLRLAQHGTALIAADDAAGKKFHAPYALAKAAQSALTRAWAAEAGNRLTIAEIVPPPMPTALRGRFYPGEN
ncbi:MAG TPA: SDR family oxidoreductase, partial [Thermohalobaculum sp.]|nr:SDR family oxidoreductase [Thermohalobaculum sp.]